MFFKIDYVLSDLSIYAISNETKGPYPFGEQTWYFFEDAVDACGADKIYKAQLSFSSCDENAFNCHDGTWYAIKTTIFQTLTCVITNMCFSVNITKRCNGVLDCHDKSDEVDCRKIHVDEAYLKDFAPSGMDQDNKLEIFTKIDILNILELDEVLSLMTIQVRSFTT